MGESNIMSEQVSTGLEKLQLFRTADPTYFIVALSDGELFYSGTKERFTPVGMHLRYLIR